LVFPLDFGLLLQRHAARGQIPHHRARKPAIVPPKPFLVITPLRGGTRGAPIMIGELFQIDYFADEALPRP
jgi:hypothetical protein